MTAVIKNVYSESVQNDNIKLYVQCDSICQLLFMLIRTMSFITYKTLQLLITLNC